MNKLTILILALCSLISNAQVVGTRIHETGGNTTDYHLASLDSILYDISNTNMILHQSGGNVVYQLIANVDSITFTTATCSASFTDLRDGEVYSIVQIGDQCWMAENLRYDVPGVVGMSDTIYPGSPSPIYGRLYDWPTAMDDSASSASNPSGIRGICPNGWHIPSDSEWNEMESALGVPAADTGTVGYRGAHAIAIKSLTGWNNSLSGADGNGTNQSGFNAFPAGRTYSGFFEKIGDYAFFLSATEPTSILIWTREVNTGNTAVGRYGYMKGDAHSCRCVKD